MKNRLIATLFSFGIVFSTFADTTKQEKIMELSEKEQSIALISADTALGDMDQLKLDLETALNDKILTVNEIKEILVQMYAYCGFPRSLNAINKFLEIVEERKKVGIKDKLGEKGKILSSDKNKNEYGESVRAKLVGSNKTAPYALFVPVIDDYLKEHLFADIFARGVLSYQEREIATISALAARDGVKAQRDAHIGIGKNTGLSQGKISEILKLSSKAKISRVALRDPVFEIGGKNDAFAKYFKGQSYLKMLADGVANVTFEPRCRNNWHIHHGKTQILLVTGGRGYYQEFGKSVRELHKGDVVVIAPGTKHWHGAACDSWFSHISIESGNKEGTNQWLEEVSDEEYNKLR